jgi:hypothetical protein
MGMIPMTFTHKPLMNLAAIFVLLLSPAVSRADTSPPSGKACVLEAMQGVQEGWLCVLSEEVQEARFEGFVMYETQDGALRPVTDVDFQQMGAKPDPPVVGTYRTIKNLVAPDGSFTALISFRRTSSLRRENGQFVSRHSEERFLFLLEAKGCKTTNLQVHANTPPQVIIMRCPDRPGSSAR